jgi:hypothetical protein
LLSQCPHRHFELEDWLNCLILQDFRTICSKRGKGKAAISGSFFIIGPLPANTFLKTILLPEEHHQHLYPTMADNSTLDCQTLSARAAGVSGVPNQTRDPAHVPVVIQGIKNTLMTKPECRWSQLTVGFKPLSASGGLRCVGPMPQ